VHSARSRGGNGREDLEHRPDDACRDGAPCNHDRGYRRGDPFRSIPSAAGPWIGAAALAVSCRALPARSDPGNIPNIVCAGALGIRSGEWAKIGIPIGLAMLGICFAILAIVN